MDYCTRQHALDAIEQMTGLLPCPMDADEDWEDLIKEYPQVAEMIDYIFYDGEEMGADYNDIRMARAADIVSVASAILSATTGNPWNGKADRFPDLNPQPKTREAMIDTWQDYHCPITGIRYYVIRKIEPNKYGVWNKTQYWTTQGWANRYTPSDRITSSIEAGSKFRQIHEMAEHQPSRKVAGTEGDVHYITITS